MDEAMAMVSMDPPIPTLMKKKVIMSILNRYPMPPIRHETAFIIKAYLIVSCTLLPIKAGAINADAIPRKSVHPSISAAVDTE
jgi:hypothetical protein